MKLSLDYEDLKAIVCLANVLAGADGSVGSSEILSVFKSLQDHYDMDDDYVTELIHDADEMQAFEALERVGNFGPAAKQFTVNLLGNVVLADRELTEKEKSLYDKIRAACSLPNFEESSFHASLDVSDGYVAGPADELELPAYIVLDDLKKVDFPDRMYWESQVSICQFEHLPLANLQKLLDSEEPLITFRESAFLTQLNKAVADADLHFIILCRKKGGRHNKPASLLRDQDVFGPCVIALESPQYYLHGFTSRELLRTTVKALNIISEPENQTFVEPVARDWPDGRLEELNEKVTAGILAQIDNLK